MDKQGKKRLISLVVTLAIISVLLFSGPVRALTLGITDLVASIVEQNNVSFLAKADIRFIFENKIELSYRIA